MYFAQIDAGGICFAVTESHQPLVGPQFVPLAFFDTSVLGRRWDGSAWVTP